MTDNKLIFGQHFKSRETLEPAQKDITDFLRKAAGDKGREAVTSGMEIYRRLIKEARASAQGGSKGREGGDLRVQMLYGVLGHANLTDTALLSAVVLYHYHLHALDELDFKGPSSFIRSAENEMGRLNRKKIGDVMRMARLQEMIAERKKILDGLRDQWTEIAGELRRIVVYIRDNLVRIEKLCAASVVILAELDIGKQREKQVIEEVKAYYRVKFKEGLRGGKATVRVLENAKKELDWLTEETTVLLRDDAEALTRLYEALHDHMENAVMKLDALLSGFENKKSVNVLETMELLRGGGQILVAFLSGCRIEPPPTQVPVDSDHGNIVRAKRREMLDYLFEEVRKERRARKERRSFQDRRKTSNPDYAGPERRKKERRSAKGRRS